MIQANKRDFNRKMKQYFDSEDTIKVSDKTGIVGFFVPATQYFALTTQKSVSDNLSDKIDNLSDNIEDIEENVDKCVFCGNTNTRVFWEDGEEYHVCEACVRAKHGKYWKAVWRKMRPQT